VRAAAEDGRTTEDGTCCGACQQVETAKKKKTPREKAKNAKKHMTDKGGFGLFHAKFIKQNLFISV
jgi:hypothetical protein